MVRERLQKVLASAGVASRRRAEDIVASGQVTVNGHTARLGDSADPELDEIRVSGVPLARPHAHTYVALNKPRGLVTSLRSTHGERTVMELLPGAGRLFPVGRLDKDTSGLLLLTDDGDWANLVSHPRYGIEKEYEVVAQGLPTSQQLRRLREGVELPDGTLTAPAVGVSLIGDDGGNARLSITVFEGKKRQIRLMMAAVGHPVLALKRVRIGTIGLASQPEGRWRRLSEEEVQGIRDLARRNTHRAGKRSPSAG